MTHSSGEVVTESEYRTIRDYIEALQPHEGSSETITIASTPSASMLQPHEGSSETSMVSAIKNKL